MFDIDITEMVVVGFCANKVFCYHISFLTFDVFNPFALNTNTSFVIVILNLSGSFWEPSEAITLMVRLADMKLVEP